MKGTLTNLETGDIFDLLNVSLIGRSAESNILIADPRASRRHAMIRKQDNGFWFFDLGSFNGSYLNGIWTLADGIAPGDAVRAEILEHAKDKLARYKVPRSIDFEPELPRLETGKLYKRLLKDRYWGKKDSRIV